MFIPTNILDLRKEYMSKGDNKAIAALASKGKKKFTPRDISMAIKRGRTPHMEMIKAMHSYYTERRSMIAELSNVEMAQ